MKNLDNHKVIFVTERFAGDSTSYGTDGTIAGTIHLGDYVIKSDFIKYSFYKNRLILTEKSTNFDLFPPVITDGTPEGTKLVTDFINDSLAVGISDVQSAVGTTDFLFVKTVSGGKVFDGNEVSNFPLTGNYNHGFKLGHLNIVFSDFDIMVYDSLDGTSKLLPVEPYYFSEPVSNAGKVYFHNSDSYIYETDGNGGTKKISSLTTGSLNYDPYLFATDDFLLYSTNNGNNTELWTVDLTTDLDSLFSTIKRSSNNNFSLNAFMSGEHLIYARSTTAEGYEYWVYNPLPTGIRDLTASHPLMLSPNPAENELIISFDSEIPAQSSLSIFNVTGQIVFRSAIDADQMRLDISSFIPGQ